MATTNVYRLRVTMVGIDPPIWRTVAVPGSMKLCCLHDVLQIAMGWTDSHLHMWERGGKFWGVPEFDDFDELDLENEDEVEVGTMLGAVGDSMVYVYDFGDDWRHLVTLEEIVAVDGVVKAPVCLDGARRCPPEDVGGMGGYEAFLKVIFDPAHKEYEFMVAWAGGHFHDEFRKGPVNARLAKKKWPARHRR